MSAREIVHVDMDAFYASVEQRDDPSLRGKPVVVAWRGNRSVVCAASYEARKFGIRSAMPAVTAERLCPSATFIPPDFTRYRAVSQACREIFRRHTERIEPLSLDEAYLDVTGRESGLEAAQTIRAEIREELCLTASAGVAPNKFLSKIASDWRKPDGLFEIRPEDIDGFLAPLPVGKLPGVGKVTEERLEQLGLRLVGDIRTYGLPLMESQFGRSGRRLYQLSCGHDESEVVSDRPTQSISAEDTFATDVFLRDTTPTLIRLAERVWHMAVEEGRPARTVVLKLKTSDFKILTRSQTPGSSISSGEELIDIALALLERVELDPTTTYRLAGVGLSNFLDPQPHAAQPTLFDW
ncbi:DNA polymerase IV [Fimbriimonas ginsengisoli]|uniref:DNA polymerase IV n=1 Tax=Fimbriimonas ginsengisoli Gsoil 348 TaxID=661478 RepID=A0A068NXX5_FIMGI|nr:DNA polymerase IV [Fimbriimonas ginsengisoli]AIE86504.1 putative DNA polymerase IV [Fimbriimonas ginsengisoli Gsoil 348]